MDGGGMNKILWDVRGYIYLNPRGESLERVSLLQSSRLQINNSTENQASTCGVQDWNENGIETE